MNGPQSVENMVKLGLLAPACGRDRPSAAADLLVEAVVTEYWCIAQGLNLEIKMVPLALEYDIHNGLGGLIRHGTASRRALRKNLEMLEKLSQVAKRGKTEDDDLLDNESPTPVLPTDGAGSREPGASVSEQAVAEIETAPPV